MSGISELDKDRKQREARQQSYKKGTVFANLLNQAMEEAPAQFKTVVYGRDGKVSTVQYQTREYR